MAMCSLHLLQQAKQGTLFVHPSHQWFVIQLFPKKKNSISLFCQKLAIVFTIERWNSQSWDAAEAN